MWSASASSTAELRSDAVVSADTISLDVALGRYQDSRDRLSRALVAVAESVCRYDWDDDAIRTLLRQVSSAMSEEMDHLSARDHRRLDLV